MGVKKFYATADTTITDAFTEDLKTRGSGSNMGKADTLEVFSLYDQTHIAEKASDGKSSIMPQRELARTLLKFDAAAINAEFLDPEIGAAAGLPKAYLKLSNAVHPFTLPSGYSLDVYALDQAFDEGHGMDADEYSDSGSVGQVAAASWAARAYDTPTLTTAATGTFHVDVNPTTKITVRIGGHQIDVTPDGTPGDPGAKLTATAIATGITTANSPMASLVAATATDGQVDISAKNIGGNFIPISISSSTGSILRNSSDWTAVGLGGKNGGSTLSGGVDTLPWTTAGGDFGTGTSPLLGTQTFEDGDEDLFVDVTSYFVSVRDVGGFTDRGLIIKLSSDDEAALRSFYTKKFFARSSQYFFLRPCIEVRWDSSTQDDRGNFFASHPMRSTANTIVLKNYVDGAIVAAETEPTDVNVWVDSTKNVSLLLDISVTGATTGTYSSVITLDTDLEEVYIEWVNVNGATTTVLHTETIEVKQRSATETNTTPEYVISITNLKPSYLGKDPSEDTPAEIARFRLYTRLKDWSPTIYSKATKETKTDIIEQAYYKIIRLADEFTVFDYGIDGDEHTKLSYDADGNYFDIDMSLLEVGYSYGIKFMFVIRGEQREQPEVFKFRVE